MRRYKYLIVLSLTVAACLILLCQALARTDPCMVKLQRPDGVVVGYGIEERRVNREITIRVYLGPDYHPPDPCIPDAFPPDPCLPGTKYKLTFSLEVKNRNRATARGTIKTNADGSGETLLIVTIPKKATSPVAGRITAVSMPPDPVHDPIVSEPFTVFW